MAKRNNGSKPAARSNVMDEQTQVGNGVPPAAGTTEEQQPPVLDQTAPAPATAEQTSTTTAATAPAPAAEQPAPAPAPAAPAPAAIPDGTVTLTGKLADGRTVEVIAEFGKGELQGCMFGQVVELPTVAPGSNEVVTKAIGHFSELVRNGQGGSKVHLVRKVALYADKALARKQVLEVIRAVSTGIADATVFTQFQVARKTGKA